MSSVAKKSIQVKDAMRRIAPLLFAFTGSLALASSSLVGAATLTVSVTDQDSAPVGDAVVYATPLVATVAHKAPAPAEIAQINKAFAPLVSVVQTGAALSFPNKDPFRHHVYSFSPAKTFELKLYSGVPAAPVVFDKPGVVILGCNIHDSMVAYLLVVDTPFFAKSDATGQAHLDGLPTGDYEVRVWHARLANPVAARTINTIADTSFKTSIDLKPKTLIPTEQ
jgi:hypothetical protein